MTPGLGPTAQRKLLERFGSAGAVYAASQAQITEFAGPEACRVLARPPDRELLEDTLRWAEEPGHHLITFGSPEYPPMLAHIQDPPVVLHAIGRIELLHRPTLAIVGSRNASRQALLDAYSFARTFSDAGLCIASGLATGVDAAAHRGGLDGASSSVAVLGTGPDRVYPRANQDLARRIAQAGCVVTEYWLGTPSIGSNFPRRNRLISGLSRGVFVVEAAEKSGSLGTARLAAAQGRDVFAMPGSIHSTLSRGCHKLIKEGAKLVECANDVLEELRFTTSVESLHATHATREDGALLQAMGFNPHSLDEMTLMTGLPVGEIAAQLSLLEIDGTIAALPGGRFQRLRRN